jgi:hypothetical protein
MYTHDGGEPNATMTTDERAAKVGDPKVLARELRQASADAKFLEARWDTLLAHHRDQWVGVHKRELIFAGSLKQLIARAQRKGWDVGTMVVDCLTDKRPAALL